MRKQYLDNIRWITVLLVVIYHVFYMYNGVEVFGIIGPFEDGVQYQDSFLYLVYPWFMLLLFVVSGMSARFYLNGHTEKEYKKSKTDKLLVPSTVGLFTFYWILGYYNTALAGAFETMPPEVPGFIKYLIIVVSGTGPLWYIQLLWVFSMALLLVRKIEKDKLYDLCGKANIIVLLLFTFAVWGAAQILNTPVVTVYRFGIYGLGFFIGYFVLSHDEVMERLEKYYVILCVAAGVLFVAFFKLYWQQPYAESVVLETPLCNFYAWIAVLAILSFMHKHGDFSNGFTTFMNSKSWGLYLFHYIPLAMIAYYLHRYNLDSNAVITYLIVGVGTFAGSLILNEVISRIPVIRFLAMGIRSKKSGDK